MRVIIADDGPVFREGVSLLLAREGVDVVGCVGDVPSAVDAVEATRPDVILLDMRMPPGQEREGIDAAVEIRRRQPNVGILVLTAAPSAANAIDVFASAGTAGVGYYSKDAIRDVDHLVEAMRRVAAGECAVDPIVPSTALDRSVRQPFVEQLTPAERTIVEYMAMGLSNRGIADASQRSERTVEVHVQNIYRKLGLLESTIDRRVVVVLSALAGERPRSR